LDAQLTQYGDNLQHYIIALPS